ncbi:MFS transporter [Thermodesulfobacteriota bacterium]
MEALPEKQIVGQMRRRQDLQTPLIPLSGKLADRFDAKYVATLGLVFLVFGIWRYACLETNSSYLWVAASFALIGMGIGFFTPANQRRSFASVRQEHYGIVSAMLTSFSTASGTMGITGMVALIARLMGSKEFEDPAAFASAQQFAFLAMLPLAGAAILISLFGDMKQAPK